jgi:hypothetical protein
MKLRVAYETYNSRCWLKVHAAPVLPTRRLPRDMDDCYNYLLFSGLLQTERFENIFCALYVISVLLSCSLFSASFALRTALASFLPAFLLLNSR